MKIDTLEAALEKQRDCNFKDELRSLPERLRSPFARVELTVVEAKGLATRTRRCSRVARPTRT